MKKIAMFALTALASSSSFALPGAGQLMTGDYGSGLLHLAAQAAIMAGGMTLALVNSVLASRGARAGAQANLDSGKVKIEPRLSMMGGGLGMGMTLGLR